MDRLSKVLDDFRQYGVEVRLKHQHKGFGWVGFWIGLGLVLAAAILKGQIILK